MLTHDLLCASCGNQASTQCDHIISARIVLEELGVDEFFNPARCQGLCASCHSQKTAIECGWAGVGGAGGTAITADDLGDRDCSNITVVCGLPGVGKSYYVAEHKRDGDLVWDWDVELAAATGQDTHANTLSHTLQSMLAMRDSFVHQARWSNARAWIIISRMDAALTLLLQSAGAALVLLVIDESERLSRLAARARAGA